MPQTSQRVWKRLWWSPNWLRWWKVPKRHFTAARQLVLTCKLHRLVLTCKSFSVHACTYHCTQCTMSCKHFGKLTNSTRQCHCAKVLIWTMAAWPVSTLQLAPALLIYKKFVIGFVSRRYSNTYFMVSSSGFVWICSCWARPLLSSSKQLHCKAVRRERGRNWFSRLLRNLGIFVTTVSCQFCLCFVKVLAFF